VHTKRTGDIKAWLAAAQPHFNALLRETIAYYEIEASIAFPELSESAVIAGETLHLPVDGMHGGFTCWIEDVDGALRLMVESWCRVVDGSGLRHAVTPDGSILLDRGFV
jgi:hypothetical protein